MMQSRPVGDALLDEIVGIIRRSVSPRLVILFGSRARGDAHDASDIDIMVVIDDHNDERKSHLRIYAALEENEKSADIIVRSAAGFESRREDVGTLDYQAARDGRILHCRYDVVAALTSAVRVRETPSGSGRPPSVAEWVARAHNDLSVMRKVLSSREPEPDGVCFHAHQSAEKLLKALIIAGHQPPPRSHDLTHLLDSCQGDLSGNALVRAHCTLLQRLWPRSRYPDATMPDEHEAASAAAAAEGLQILLMSELGLYT